MSRGGERKLKIHLRIAFPGAIGKFSTSSVLEPIIIHRCWGRLFPKAKVIHIKFSLECRRQWRLNWQGFTPVVPFFGRFVFGASLEMRGRSRKKSKNDRTIYEFDTRTLNLFLKHVSKSLHHISLFFTVEGKRNCDLWVAGALPDALCRISCLKFAVICCVIKMRLVKQQTT